ncbi:PF11827 domain protein [Leptospira weilii str. Ecochallenge]|uniref:PF11827 domain protein n=1 Tax=Leptospira weilii str. Ecochallenge TaxID=1049986 RepID=N1U352_9LEPT|nr:PF11827 domain protein [Leptospira weilii str. Ecochallenge]
MDRIHKSFLNGKEVFADPLIASLQQEAARDSSIAPALKAAEKLKNSVDEKAKLEAYAELSEALKDYIQKDESMGFHVFYCPMVKKKWIASGDKVQNPYDSSMKSCGKKI